MNGIYGAGSHRTGIPGILETTKSPQEIFDLLKDEHQYGSLGLNDSALWDLTKFVVEGLIETDQIIDQEGKFTPLVKVADYSTTSRVYPAMVRTG